MGFVEPGSRVPDTTENKEQHLLLFQVPPLEPEMWQQQQQEEQLQKPLLHPPYYDLGVSPSHHPLVRTAGPQGQDSQARQRAQEGKEDDGS